MFEKHLCKSDILSKDAGIDLHLPWGMLGHCDINAEPSPLICSANQLSGIYLDVAMMAWYVLFEAPEIDLNKIYPNYFL